MEEARLIDANMIRKYISNRQIQIAGILEKVDGWIELENVLNAIKKIPTIDPESLRPVSCWDSSGKYTFMDKKNSIAVRCENCGCALHMREYKESVWKFCPVCGARMEGE